MPLRVNAAGVMPIIFAQAILMFPAMLFVKAGEVFNQKAVSDFGHALERGHWVYYALYTLMILFFSYFWVATQFNELQIADDLKKNGGYIPGVRPGQATSEYLHNAMSRQVYGRIERHDDGHVSRPSDRTSAGPWPRRPARAAARRSRRGGRLRRA